MSFVKLRLWLVVGLVSNAAYVTPRPADAPAPLPFVEDSWTLAVLPDSQNYVGKNVGIFDTQTRWIAENAKKRHTAFVLHQMLAKGGEGYLRLVEFLPDGKTIQVKTYSPYLDRYMTTPDQQFILALPPPPRM